MKTISNPAPAKWEKLARRPEIRPDKLRKMVNDVFRDIAKQGDRAVLKYSRKFDYPEQTSLSVEQSMIDKAAENLSQQLKQSIDLARQNIEKFHLSQREVSVVVETVPGVTCWRESRAIEKVGIYIPGGSAPLFSTVLMLAIPAKIAGCSEIVLCTPPDKFGNIHPAILYTAQLTGVTKIFAIGGMQAIGAMTFGTESVPKTDKIFGPGNQYVMAAKRYAQLQGVAIDMPAGPSEVLVIADESCNPSFVAADLLSQAEHGPDSQVMLVTDSKKTIKEILKEIDLQIALLPRQDIAAQALKNSRAILLNNLDECLAFSNLYAPEHLILAIENSAEWAKKVINAGSVFLGRYSCESLGDYASGTNHTLPTSGFAKAYSGVSLDSFVKKITFQQVTEQGICEIGPAVETMAEAEQLLAHKNAVTLRLKETLSKS
ncbi:MAG TPA: histidinol dehydrogenase [Dysgonamonadaceae bacterium]|nr:histidinol dehydrogenase [Dysgonamonadaceae bacterium]HPD42870.1 histidinol dehydrogenase [Dysgonamonadaceae bacterium]HRS41546.1 histidinol dehydrogenase [Dysgonamonadaceae bacterium]HRU12250.1 histidinol dehydrogenase [Dysgonamonadaceae bacterium]